MGGAVSSLIGKSRTTFAGAKKWRARTDLTNDPTYWGLTDLKFMTSAGAGAMPGSGTGSSSTIVTGSVANLFDGNLSSEWAIAHGGGTGFAEYDFVADWVITHVAMSPRLSFTYQAPRRLFVEYDQGLGAGWILAGTILDVGNINPSESRVYPIATPTDEPGGHRYWRCRNMTCFGGTLIAWIEMELLQSGAVISRRFRGLTSDVTDFDRLVDGTVTGDNFAIKNPQSTGGVIRWDFGYKRNVDQVRTTARAGGFGYQTPANFDVQYSDDDSSWTTAFSVADATAYPGVNVQRTYP